MQLGDLGIFASYKEETKSFERTPAIVEFVKTHHNIDDDVEKIAKVLFKGVGEGLNYLHEV